MRRIWRSWTLLFTEKSEVLKKQGKRKIPLSLFFMSIAYMLFSFFDNGITLEAKSLVILLQEMTELNLMVTELFLTVRTR